MKRMVAFFRNLWGRLKGYSGCYICGNRWNWKKPHLIELETRTISGVGEMNICANPVCEECWETQPTYKVIFAADKLAYKWMHESSWIGFKEACRRASVLRKNTEQQLTIRGERYESQHEHE